jgi:hypothetical protein
MSDLQTPGKPTVDNGSVFIKLDSRVHFFERHLPGRVVNEIRDRLTFKNPRYAHEKRHNPGTKAHEYFRAYFEADGVVSFPRGFMNEFIRILQRERQRYDIHDVTNCPEYPCVYDGELFGQQVSALREMAPRRFGILAGPVAETRPVAVAWIGERRTRALVVVRQLADMHQWAAAIRDGLDVNPSDIGIVGEGKTETSRPVIVGTDRSLYRCLDEIRDELGAVIVPECNRANWRIYREITGAIPSRYLLGLASAPRRDKLDAAMRCHVGPVLARVKSGQMMGSGGRLVITPTGWGYDYRDDYGEMLGALTADTGRNEKIVVDILACTAERGKTALVLSERVKHLEALREAVGRRCGCVIHGKTPEKDVDAALEAFGGRVQVLPCTAKSIGKISAAVMVDAVVIASPIADGAIVAAAVAMLKSGGTVYDYADDPPVLRGSMSRRMKQYTHLKKEVQRHEA